MISNSDDKINRTRHHEADPKVEVLGGLQALVEALNAEPVAAHQHGRHSDIAGRRERLESRSRQDAVKNRRQSARRRAAGGAWILFVKAAGNETDFRPTVENLQLPFQLLWLPIVVGVQECDKVAVAMVEAEIAALAAPPLALCNRRTRSP